MVCISFYFYECVDETVEKLGGGPLPPTTTTTAVVINNNNKFSNQNLKYLKK